MSYNDYLKLGFDVYRRWFNRMFRFSFNGKYAGLLRLGSHLSAFIKKLARILNRSSRQRPLGDVISFKIAGFNVKLYDK